MGTDSDNSLDPPWFPRPDMPFVPGLVALDKNRDPVDLPYLWYALTDDEPVLLGAQGHDQTVHHAELVAMPAPPPPFPSLVQDSDLELLLYIWTILSIGLLTMPYIASKMLGFLLMSTDIGHLMAILGHSNAKMRSWLESLGWSRKSRKPTIWRFEHLQIRSRGSKSVLLIPESGPGSTPFWHISPLKGCTRTPFIHIRHTLNCLWTRSL